MMDTRKTVVILLLLLGMHTATGTGELEVIRLNILHSGVRVAWDEDRVPHIHAQNAADAAAALGYLHAQCCLFAMDWRRRLASGTSAELLGEHYDSPRLDPWLRTIGLRRAAQLSLDTYPAEIRAELEAYASGVNAWLDNLTTELPPEFAALKLTRASIPRWTALDSVAVLKFFSFMLSYGEGAIDNSIALAAHQAAGMTHGFDGTKLFFEDARRFAPFEPVFTIPDWLLNYPATTATTAATTQQVNPETFRIARQYRENSPNSLPILARQPGAALHGSNWFLISGELTDTGHPMIGNDPHLDFGPLWELFETHLIVSDPGQPMNAAGMTLAGVPAIICGCNERICWNLQMTPLSVTDIRQEKISDGSSGTPTGTIFEGRVEPLDVIPQKFFINRGDGVDDIVPMEVDRFSGGVTYIVRRHGPLIKIDPNTGIAFSTQWTGLYATQEFQAYKGFACARGLDDFRKALQYHSVGGTNWGYADVDGNIACFVTGEVPLRKRLQAFDQSTGKPTMGMSPSFIQDGTSDRNEWQELRNPQPGQVVPFEIIPRAEMPFSINPEQGFLVAGNNDPVGVSVGNDPLGHMRPGGGIYLLAESFERGLRIATITEMIRGLAANGHKITFADLPVIQASTVSHDAKVFVPYLVAAFANAQKPDTAAELKALANDRRMAEAIDRLAHWDFSSPPGIREGYTLGRGPDSPNDPSREEVASSVAATLYAVWRGQFVIDVIQTPFQQMGLGNYCPPADQQLSLLRILLDNSPTMKGRGASGVNFFQADRDTVILRCLRKALDLLKGPAFAPAFNGSENLDDYRWGKLHRLIIYSPLNGDFNVPPAGGFANLSPGLSGISRGGGYGTPDVAGHPLDGQDANAFNFSGGAVSRLIASLPPNGIRASSITVWGQSSVPGTAGYGNMFERWLKNMYHPIFLTDEQVRSAQTSETLFTPVSRRFGREPVPVPRPTRPRQ
ncbi:MAG: penicillin acylase family protein [Minisyncoccia bacterium]|jgi:penicillin amidase